MNSADAMNVGLCFANNPNNVAKAEPLFRRAHATRRAQLGGDHPSTQFAHHELTAVQRALGIS